MFEHKTLQNLDEYFLQLNMRPQKSVYFYRINSFSEKVKAFLKQYYEAARLTGVVIEGRIPNPDEKNLEYYEEIMGLDFQMNPGFLLSSLKKWLPRMNDSQCEHVAASVYDTLDLMQRQGKNENMLRNAYIKFMCWLYYKFERILNQLGNDQLPKILYEGEISNYELRLISILSKAGCDVVLLQYKGDEAYRKLDPDSTLSVEYREAGAAAFPEGYCIGHLRKEQEEEVRLQRLYGTMPKTLNCTNAWITGSIFEDVQKSPQARGMDEKLFYNCFCRVNGVEDKVTYVNSLYQFRLQLKSARRKLVIVENEISAPNMEEISAVSRKPYDSLEQMLLDLPRNLNDTADQELKRLMVKSFVDVMMEESRQEDNNRNRLTNLAVYLICWIRRYRSELFSGWKLPEISCFLFLGGVKSRAEALFLKLLARLPVDVLLLRPDRNDTCILSDSLLYEVNHPESLAVDRFPREDGEVHMDTAAYHAERELDTLMYQDTGMYRNFQYEKAVSVSLRTMYEEIAILWDQELKFRPNFSVVDSVVNLPVLSAKVSGVKDGQVAQYWQGIKSLITPDVFVIKEVPFLRPTDENPVKNHAVEFFKNGRLQKNKIKGHPVYQYGFLRDEMQDYILDKLALLIEQRTIKGTLENGTEYTIVSVVLNLKKEIVRLIQKFDFTKKNPKLVYINTTEDMISLEDSILTAFLNLAGFDVVFFVPTGYENVEKYFNRELLEEHQIGDYVYDLRAPDFSRGSQSIRHSWREKIFKRGN